MFSGRFSFIEPKRDTDERGGLSVLSSIPISTLRVAMPRSDSVFGPLDILSVPMVGLPDQETVDVLVRQSGRLTPEPLPKVPLHRLAERRHEQGVSLSTVAKKLGVEIAEARRQEQPTTDLLLSQLYRWRDVLELPIGELVIELEEIPTNPIKNRSQLVKMMKSVRAILETTGESGTRVHAEVLAAQFIDLMPELRHINAWPSVGQSREQRDLGQAAHRRFDITVARSIEE